MRHMNWWYVGGAVATIAIAATLGEIWSLGGVVAVAVAWGGVIGGDIQESRRRTSEGRSRAPEPKWLVPLLTLLVTASLLAIGLFLGVGMDAIWGESEFVTAPLITGAILGVFAIVGVLALLHRKRRRSL